MPTAHNSNIKFGHFADASGGIPIAYFKTLGMFAFEKSKLFHEVCLLLIAVCMQVKKTLQHPQKLSIRLITSRLPLKLSQSRSNVLFYASQSVELWSICLWNTTLASKQLIGISVQDQPPASLFPFHLLLVYMYFLCECFKPSICLFVPVWSQI